MLASANRPLRFAAVFVASVLDLACGPAEPIIVDAGAVGDAAADAARADAAAGCLDDSQCSDPTPRCDVHSGQCAQCLPWNDHCVGGTFCDSSFRCVSACNTSADCYTPDGGAPLQCCSGLCSEVCEPDGGVLAAASCKDILAAAPGSLSGVYSINVNGKSFQVYCDMVTNGGGWTKVTFPLIDDLSVQLLLGAAGRQMMKCSDDDSAKYVISPPFAATSWSWNAAAFVQVPGNWNVDGHDNYCGHDPARDNFPCTFGVGCGNAGSSYFLPGWTMVCSDRTAGTGNGPFGICGNGFYLGWSVFVRAG